MVNVAVSVTVEWQVWCEPRESHVGWVLPSCFVGAEWLVNATHQEFSVTPQMHWANADVMVSPHRTIRVWLKRDSGQYWPSVYHTMSCKYSCFCFFLLIFVHFFVSTVWFSAFFLRQFLKTKAMTMLEQADWLTCSASSKKKVTNTVRTSLWL